MQRLNSEQDYWNSGYWVEGLDRLSNLGSIAEMMLGEVDGEYHPAIERANLQKEMSELLQSIHMMYQKLGAAIPEGEW